MSWFVQDANKPKPESKREIPKEIGIRVSQFNDNEKPSNKMLWAVLVTLFGFLPFGIMAVIKAAQVDPKWKAGDKQGARESADKAVRFAVYAVIAQVVIFIIILLKEI